MLTFETSDRGHKAETNYIEGKPQKKIKAKLSIKKCSAIKLKKKKAILKK
jgi:hypothetical protein